MTRRFRYRSLLSLILAFCLIGTSLWSVSGEVLADVLSDEVNMVAMHAHPDQPPSDKACNHGCHAQSHVAGLESHVSPGKFETANDAPSSRELMSLPAPDQEPPLRPPRSTFQA